MRGLGGGEGGIVDLGRIRSSAQGLGFSQAAESWTSRTGGKYVSSLRLTLDKT
jgi:hypothetical protein